MLHSFTGGTDGGCPRGGLTFDSSGNLFGATAGGCYGGQGGSGTVFELTVNGNETVLYNFTGQETVGFQPYGDLTLDTQGNLYGTTFYSGFSSLGTVFQVSPNGQEDTLYSFMTLANGEYPTAGVVRDAAGNLYGVTSEGGVDCAVDYGCGVLFEITPTGQEIVLHLFGVNSGDGYHPYGELLLVGTMIFGTTNGGGTQGFGTVFSFDLSSGTETVLYSFAGGSDGKYPDYEALIQDATGDLYGTTNYGGSHEFGTIFKLDQRGTETVLYTFTGGTDGGTPYGGLLIDSQGNLYGTAFQEASLQCGQGCGSVYKLSTTGKLTVLHDFSGSDGQQPWSTLVMDATGNLYGTTSAGGANGYGNIFKLTPSS